MELNALVDSFLPQSEKSVELKNCTHNNLSVFLVCCHH